jgi:hypothetical protein
MLLKGSACPNCSTEIALGALFYAVGVDTFGRLKQPAGVICRTCDAKLRVDQPGIVLMNIAAFVVLASCVGIIERRAGINTRGTSGVAMAILCVVCFATIRRWYIPSLARLEVVAPDHEIFLPLEQDRTRSI